jgi:hypothetical protein
MYLYVDRWIARWLLKNDVEGNSHAHFDVGMMSCHLSGRDWRKPLKPSINRIHQQMHTTGLQIVRKFQNLLHVSAPKRHFQGVSNTEECKQHIACVISGFRRDVDESCDLLGYYAA